MFTVYGPGITDPIRLEKLLQRPAVAKAGAVSPNQAIQQDTVSAYSPAFHQSDLAKKKYSALEDTGERQPSLKASQIMTAPVISVQVNSTALEALNILDAKGIRHIPVMSPENQLVGIVSDRDVVRCMCDSGTVCLHCSKDKQDMLISDLMKDHVLTTSTDTEARYIARLFVEKRISAIPVMKDNSLVGIITRSDILRAVMQHFDLNTWT